ncbi:4293_t:CDS:2 [Paraglomus brasilianum]|uniref:Dihydrolipoamide acetyltransferase component of pyruvate dehydrogenase complex n=1 Tax=Paraglomus brasilianum TaxID=144538 RepID=A0A9N9GG74_9GLOM|nr:4293_t:CDS:2 [Paraglomus brasilianum]
MPALSPTMTEGTIVSWKKQEGQKYSAGEVLLEIESDKAQIEVEAPEDGLLAKILISGGQRCAVGSVIALTAEEDDDISNLEIPDTAADATKSTGNSASKKNLTDAAHSKSGNQRLSPAVAHLLLSNGITDTAKIATTGPKGRLLKGDVLAYMGKIKPPPATKSMTPAEVAAAKTQSSDSKKHVSKAKTTPSPLPESTDKTISEMRKTGASDVTKSKSTVPHSYVQKDIVLDNLLQFRHVLNEKFRANVAMNDFFVKATALALRDVPMTGVRYAPNEKDLREQLDSINISAGTPTPAGISPSVMENANQKGLLTISELMKELTEKAHGRDIQLENYEGGTFRISNVGVDDFTEIIDPPRTCTLAIGSVTKRAAADDIDYLSRKHSSHVESQNSSSIDIIDYLTGTLPKAPQVIKSVESEFKQNIEGSQIVSAKLSIDERVIDTATASKFLERLSYYIQYPQKMIT